MLDTPIKTFGFAGKSWHELHFELAVSYDIIGELLVKSLSLQNYGTGLMSTLCFFVCVPFEDTNKNFERFFSKEKQLYIVRQLDYAVFSQLSLDNALKMQANVFLQALNKVRKRRKTIPDFDFERFYADVENLFREKGWIENEKSF